MMMKNLQTIIISILIRYFYNKIIKNYKLFVNKNAMKIYKKASMDV